jgi:hypothetical protein
MAGVCKVKREKTSEDESTLVVFICTKNIRTVHNNYSTQQVDLSNYSHSTQQVARRN